MATTGDLGDGHVSTLPDGEQEEMDISDSEPQDREKKADVKLEDFFASDDDDEDFPSSAPTNGVDTKMESSSPAPELP